MKADLAFQGASHSSPATSSPFSMHLCSSSHVVLLLPQIQGHPLDPSLHHLQAVGIGLASNGQVHRSTRASKGSLIGRNGETFSGRRGSGCPPLFSTSSDAGTPQ